MTADVPPLGTSGAHHSTVSWLRRFVLAHDTLGLLFQPKSSFQSVLGQNTAGVVLEDDSEPVTGFVRGVAQNIPQPPVVHFAPTHALLQLIYSPHMFVGGKLPTGEYLHTFLLVSDLQAEGVIVSLHLDVFLQQRRLEKTGKYLWNNKYDSKYIILKNQKNAI